MADLTEATTYDFVSRGFLDKVAIVATDAIQFFAGGAVAIDTSTGRIVKAANTADYEFLGTVEKDVLGDTSATPPTEVEINISGETLQKVTVAGGSAQANVGDLVYIDTDNYGADLTVTPTANFKAIGWISRFHSGTTNDVKLFTPGEHRAVPVA